MRRARGCAGGDQVEMRAAVAEIKPARFAFAFAFAFAFGFGFGFGFGC